MKKIKPFLITDVKTILLRMLILNIFVVVIIIDRLTKTYLYGHNGGSLDLKILGINLKYVINYGIAFSSFQGLTTLFQIIGITLLILAIGAIFFKIEFRYLIPIWLIASGGFGNVLDRFMYNGGVRDFLTFPWWGRFAIFNFADSMAMIGSFVLIIFIIITMVKS